ncbi:YegP family protein [Mycolicibacterium thermoresistibile]|nr:YegP family protein [Mycolicibacterium thermoresistibile]
MVPSSWQTTVGACWCRACQAKYGGTHGRQVRAVQGPGGEYRFRLKAGNGETIAVSEGYTTRSGALNGIESVKTNAPGAPVVDLT